jgi:hypothetical protein
VHALLLDPENPKHLDPAHSIPVGAADVKRSYATASAVRSWKLAAAAQTPGRSLAPGARKQSIGRFPVGPPLPRPRLATTAHPISPQHFASHGTLRLYHGKVTGGKTMDGAGIGWILALLLGALVSGFLLARLNVFALTLASALLAALFMFYLMQDATLVHSILLSLATAFFIVQIGYLFGQFLQRPHR